MASSLSSLRERVRRLLMDTGGAIWNDEALAEGLRLALGEYQIAAARAVTLDGLDGATVTSLDARHDSLVVLGAAAYAALARAVDRAESFALGADAGELKAWGDTRLNEFKAMLCVIYPGYRPLAAATAGAAPDPARLAAEIALLGAQAGLAQAQAAAATAQEARAAAAVEQAAKDKAAEAARLAGLRGASARGWGMWES